MHLTRLERCDPINWYNPATFMCLSQASTWISNIIRRVFFFSSVSFVDIAIIGGIDDSPEIIEHKKKKDHNILSRNSKTVLVFTN
jgi:hypothetical protein